MSIFDKFASFLDELYDVPPLHPGYTIVGRKTAREILEMLKVKANSDTLTVLERISSGQSLSNFFLGLVDEEERQAIIESGILEKFDESDKQSIEIYVREFKAISKFLDFATSAPKDADTLKVEHKIEIAPPMRVVTEIIRDGQESSVAMIREVTHDEIVRAIAFNKAASRGELEVVYEQWKLADVEYTPEEYEREQAFQILADQRGRAELEFWNLFDKNFRDLAGSLGVNISHGQGRNPDK